MSNMKIIFRQNNISHLHLYTDCREQSDSATKQAMTLCVFETTTDIQSTDRPHQNNHDGILNDNAGSLTAFIYLVGGGTFFNVLAHLMQG